MDANGRETKQPTITSAKAGELCERLQSLGDNPIGGGRLAEELGLTGTRELRRLVAYARTELHLHEIIGVPGIGYFWAPAAPRRARQAVQLARRMGRCWFFIAALLGRGGAAMEAVQMVFDFMQATPGTGDADDLAALVASEGGGVAEFLDRFVGRLAESDAGRQVLAEAGARHAQVLLTDAARREILADVDALRSKLLGLPAA